MISKYPILALIFILLTSCAAYKTLKYGGIPDQNDYRYFPQRKIVNAKPCFNYFRPNKNYNLGQKIGVTNRDLNPSNINLDSFMNIHKTISFLIIRNDTIIYESYKDNYTDTSLVSTFSMVKPIISTLIGIAIDEGKIKSINDLLVDYLPEFKFKSGWDKIRIKHLLHHTSGIKFTDAQLSPVSDNAEFYWGNHLREAIVKLSIECPPDTKFHYSSANPMLLAAILEKVTGCSVSVYLQEKIWKPLGMEAPAFWSLDRDDEQGIEKAFCCLQARTIDFAKFGRLYLNGGSWNGKQIISKSWVDYSTHSDPSGNNRIFFNNNWGIGPLKYGSFFAIGLYGQCIYLYPEKNITIVRFGKAETSYHPNYWQSVFLQIIDQL